MVHLVHSRVVTVHSRVVCQQFFVVSLCSRLCQFKYDGINLHICSLHFQAAGRDFCKFFSNEHICSSECTLWGW